MPNHIQNRLQVIGDKKQVTEVLKFISSVDNEGRKVQIDFNKIKPMPDGMNLEVNEHIKMWVEVCTGQINFTPLFHSDNESFSDRFKNGNYKMLADRLQASTAFEYLLGKRKGNVKDLSNEDFNLFIQCLKNYREYGNTSWYEWSIENWGTKWNAYSQNDERNTSDTIYFQTAWSSPIELMAELSSKFPKVTLQLDYADEDSGSNTGRITLQNGEAIEVFQPESQSKEGYDIYFELHPNSVSDYKLVNGKYEYIDE